MDFDLYALAGVKKVDLLEDEKKSPRSSEFSECSGRVVVELVPGSNNTVRVELKSHPAASA